MREELDLAIVLRNKKMKVTEILKWGTYLRKVWEDHFADHLKDEEKKSIYLNEFLWHLFSYEKRDCLIADRADIAFNRKSKKSCYIFYQHSNDAFIIENANGLTVEDLINEMDIYIVDKEFNWTYIRTHETGCCGPYFCQK